MRCCIIVVQQTKDSKEICRTSCLYKNNTGQGKIAINVPYPGISKLILGLICLMSHITGNCDDPCLMERFNGRVGDQCLRGAVSAIFLGARRPSWQRSSVPQVDQSADQVLDDVS